MMENNENGVVQEVSTEVVVSDNTIVNSPASDDKVSKKNRNFNTLVVVLFILLALGLSYGSYKAGIKKANDINEKETIKNNTENKDDDKEDNNETNEENQNSISNIEDKYKDCDVVEKHKSVINFNGKDNEVLAYYYHFEPEVINDYNGLEVGYYVYLDLYINGRLSVEKIPVYLTTNEMDFTNFVETAPKYNEKRFYDSINGDEYILLKFENYITRLGIESSINYYLINSNGDLISSFVSVPETGFYGVYGTKDMIGDRNYKNSEYNDGMYTLYSDGLIDIHDNYLYVVSSNDCESADEYRLTVENGKLVSVKTFTYTYEYVIAAGQC